MGIPETRARFSIRNKVATRQLRAPPAAPEMALYSLRPVLRFPVRRSPYAALSVASEYVPSRGRRWSVRLLTALLGFSEPASSTRCRRPVVASHVVRASQCTYRPEPTIQHCQFPESAAHAPPARHQKGPRRAEPARRHREAPADAETWTPSRLNSSSAAVVICSSASRETAACRRPNSSARNGTFVERPPRGFPVASVNRFLPARFARRTSAGYPRWHSPPPSMCQNAGVRLSIPRSHREASPAAQLGIIQLRRPATLTASVPILEQSGP